MFEVPTSFIPFLHAIICVYLQNKSVGGVENLLDSQVSLCYILKHLEDRKA